ncbi:MAG: ORF6N domain-containing protein, partial [Spirochaetales bacterium]|nr:ORF6N domain-containing protein [Spirochaetales bacterium]
MTVLKGDLATRQSKALIRTFKAMKDYIGQNPVLSDTTILPRLSLQIAENTRDISLIREKMITKDDISQ